MKMCGGVEYSHHGEFIKAFFPNPKAALPVKTRAGSLSLIPWGRRDVQAGKLPKGGWARLESIHKGVWDKYRPIPVKIVVERFMEKDNQGTSHWFDLDKNSFIQGLLVKSENEQRVYVVTVSPDDKQAIHDRWPRIISHVSE